MDRKGEFERKRQKLEELKRARVERTTALQASVSTLGPLQRSQPVLDLVNSLVGERPSTPTTSDYGSDSGSNATPVSHSNFTKAVEFSTANSILADVAPVEKVIYEKEIQTIESGVDAPSLSEEEIRTQVVEEFEKEQKAKQQAAEEERLKAEIEKVKKKKKELTDEDKNAILLSQDFIGFVEHSSKIFERALSEEYDFMKDYTIGTEVERDVGSGKRVKFLCEFWDEKWSKNRYVTDVGWSPKNPELVVSSYNKNPMAVNEPDGIACIWNLHLLGSPEFVFHSQSDVLAVLFSDFHPNYVIGGTYSGQIVLWDTRAKALPVLKTPLSAGGHTHPVYSLTMVGTQNAHNLISASTDGTVCSWQLDMLTQPQDSLELTHPHHHNIEEVSITTIDFPDNETTTFWVGTEEGNVYQANRYDRAGSKAGINHYDTYKGHYGTITSMQFHPSVGSVDFSDLFLTCSVDWTVKLWRAKSIAKPSGQPTIISPLYSFEQAEDYVYDVKWSPTHPALFASVDGGAKFDLWNLNADTEVPIISTVVGQQGKALNKINWDKEGKKTAIGSSDGKVYVYDIGEMAIPKPDEWSMMETNIIEMTSAQENVGK